MLCESRDQNIFMLECFKSVISVIEGGQAPTSVT